MRNEQSRRGIAIAEFAMIMTFILVPMMAGVWDIARFVDINQILTRAAREGVVQASRNQDPSQSVKDYIQAAGLDPTKLTVTVQEGNAQPGLGQEVSVHLEYLFADDTIFPWEDFMPGGITSVAFAKME